MQSATFVLNYAIWKITKTIQESNSWLCVAVRGAERYSQKLSTFRIWCVTDWWFYTPAANILSSELFLVSKTQIWCLFTSALCLTQSLSVHKWTSQQQTHTSSL